ncbi:MAG TPA: lipid-binding SYLF domain-containing protein [Candidatus Acidoferrum sp.]|nr:lipid-binding SYLF domain-containing protein [Candidatus Acidoferrum sp.]
MLRTAYKKKSERVNRKDLTCFLTSIMLLMILPAFAGDKEKDEATLRQANLVLQGFLNSKDISTASLSKANCVLILPGVKKFGFGVGGSGGRGPLLCRSGRNFDGKWSTPAVYSVGGVSAGFQVGGSSSDFVLLLMNPKVVNQILKGKTKMGTDATAAAGPGATAASASDADILTYGKAKGLFAGVSLGGATVEPDDDANYRLYGKALTATNIVRETGVRPTTEGKSLVAVLDRKLTKHSR